MTITRKTLADAIDEIDERKKELDGEKGDLFDDYRVQLAASGLSDSEIAAEVAACKAAIRMRQKLRKSEAVSYQYELVAEVFTEITNEVSRATRVRQAVSTAASTARVDQPEPAEQEEANASGHCVDETTNCKPLSLETTGPAALSPHPTPAPAPILEPELPAFLARDRDNSLPVRA